MEEEARARIEEIRKKHYDARHHCWCYRIRGGPVRYSDDGEPQGTAGQPMLNVFQREGVTNVCCVVTRYFGGILLGAGGLVRAYTQSAKDALDAAGISVVRRWVEVAVPLPLLLFERLKLELEAHGGVLGEVEYAADVTVHALLPEERAEAFSPGSPSWPPAEWPPRCAASPSRRCPGHKYEQIMNLLQKRRIFPRKEVYSYNDGRGEFLDPEEQTEALEREMLSPFACLSSQSRGRQTPLEPCPTRTCFQRDIDRIIHSKAFRRLKHKTQVFLEPEGDHYRTRMTHTIEVSRIARTIARGLRLNEDLAEAAAYGHDLGHTPFGHAGERVLNEILPGGFAHNEQSLRVVDRLEKEGEGLNLTYEVRRGILCHTGPDRAETLEGQLLRLADKIAYINHDIDDAIRGRIIYPMDIPLSISQVLGFTHSERINTLTVDIITQSAGRDAILQSPACRDAMGELRAFMFEFVYRNPVAKGEEGKAQDMLRRLRRL